MENDVTVANGSYGSKWRLPLLLALVLMTIVAASQWRMHEVVLPAGRDAQETKNTKVNPPEKVAEKVSLTVDFGDGRRKEYEGGPWREGKTIRDLLNDIARLSVTQQGAGASAFLTKLDDVANEGAGGRNWMYSVNGQRGDRSFAVYVLRPGDQVLWTFGAQQ